MKSKAPILAFAFAMAGVLAASPAQAQEMEEETITAQVIDMTCYLNMGAKGEGHKDCAVACAEMGLQLGLLGSDGHLYFPTGPGMPAADVNPELAEFAEEQVKVTGVVHERSGARSIVIAKIEKAGY